MAPRAQCCFSLPLIAAVLAALSLHCCAKPEYYVTHDSALDSFEQPTPLPGCTDQPLKKYGLHNGLAEDMTGTTFSLTPAPQAGGTLCKGVLYTLKVDFPDARYALLTSVGGVLGNSNAYSNHWANKPDTCAGKRLLVQPKKMVATFSTTLLVPCTSASTSVTLEVTSANDDKGGFLKIAATHDVVSCPGVTCATAPAPTPVVTTPGSTTGGNSTSGEDDGDDEDGSDAQEGDDGKGGEGHDSKGGSTGPVTTTPTQSGSTATPTTASGGSMSLSGSSVSGSTVGGSGVKCAAADAATCTPSTFGYPCVNADKVSVHYAYSTCVPDNECTRGAKWTTNGPPATPLLHMAVDAKTNGYVSVGFAKKPGDMPGTDAVLGYIDANNQAFLQVFPLSKEAIGDPYPNSASMLSYSSVFKTADGRTIVCFARPLNSSDYKYSPSLDPNNLQLNQAYSTRPALVFHAAASGLTINAVSGGASGAEGGGGDTLIYVHGALMTLAWIAFAPLGATLARHRWALGDKKLAGIHVWFQMHRLIQVAAVMTSAVAFIIALTSLDAGDTKIGESHKLLGILVMALAVLQVIIAVPRPKPDSPHRHKWNLAHWWLGRTTVAVGITTCYLGIVLFHKNDAEPLARWLAPTIAWLAALLIVEVALSVMKTRHTEPKPSVVATAAPMMPGTPEGGIKGAPARSPSYGHV